MAEKSGLTGEQYRKFLIEAVKAAGQMMIDNAEDVVGHLDLMTDFSINFEFSKENKEGIKNKSKRKERFFDGFDIRVNDKLVKRKQGFINSKFVVKFKNKNKEKK